MKMAEQGHLTVPIKIIFQKLPSSNLTLKSTKTQLTGHPKTLINIK